MTRLDRSGDAPRDPMSDPRRLFDQAGPGLGGETGGRRPGGTGVGVGRDDPRRAADLDHHDGRSLDSHGRATTGHGGDRSDAFRAAMRRHDAEAGATGDGADADADGAQAGAFGAAMAAGGLLAAAAAAPQTVSPSGPAAAAGTPSTHERVLAVVAAADRALTAELHLQAGRPVAVELGVADMVPGLERIRISLATSMLEVVFVRAAETAPAAAETVAAVRALADRLAVRFPRRVVRVVEEGGEALDANADAGTGGAAAIAALFRSAGTNRS